ncbi:pyridoxal-phosphate dependent enzyme, partial [Streptomyces niveus]|uniref:pyridoxal-phosphate dependent enzyme n=1 Tax=Streptomyces niveus TaxID=193462 RepID=UPI0035DBFBEF
MEQTRLDTGRIRAARRLIDPVFLDTPLYRCEALEPGLGCAVSVKLETANPVRSFKGRGTEVVASLLGGEGAREVVCASAGNLGQALAWSGRGRGLGVRVVGGRGARPGHPTPEPPPWGPPGQCGRVPPRWRVRA